MAHTLVFNNVTLC